jgi:hypothetical protein
MRPLDGAMLVAEVCIMKALGKVLAACIKAIAKGA